MVNVDFDRVSEFLSDLDNSKRLRIPIVLGPLSRIIEHALPNWGVVLTSEEEREEVRTLAKMSYLNEWGDGRANPPSNWIRAIKDAAHSSGLVGVDQGLNTTIGEFVKLIISTLNDVARRDEYKLIDIGCGDGETSVSVMRALFFDSLHEQIELRISDASTDCRQRAEKSLESFFAGRKHKLISSGGIEKDVLSSLDENSVDIVVSNAVFHHFPDGAYIKRLLRVLRPGGFVIAGDYHTTIWHDPATVAYFLEQLGASSDALHDFRTFFRTSNVADVNSKLTREEIQANIEMIAFWRELSRLIITRGLDPSPVFEAHESSQQRLDKFRVNGLEIDLLEIMRTFYGERIEEEMRRTRGTPEFASAPEVATGDEISRERLITGRTRGVLQGFPIWGIQKAKGRIHPGSDIARVIVAQKPMVDRRAA
ncbi:class I SAM-dependent methyltransferase [Candidatus Micrarchaeota archaeon]|nr:class I SAM-dependent methyltransferase [Candidatus Micrarchaeota archaeon]